jgi:CheY-like chemotaxis protein
MAAVTTATSGHEALSILRDKSKPDYDLVLSDVMMPGRPSSPIDGSCWAYWQLMPPYACPA